MDDGSRGAETRIEAAEAVLADCLRRRDSGEQPTLEELCHDHPELEAELRELWTDWFDFGSRLRRALPSGTPEVELVGSLLHGKYRLRRRIGGGGFGTVYEAVDERGAGNTVAIKVLRPDVARSRLHLDEFRAEAQRITRLHHTNIVDWKVFDETDEGVPYLVMELVEGEELDALLRSEVPLAPDRAGRLLLGILEALRAAHVLGGDESILHLDLKPRNVFVVRDPVDGSETVKVIDFGLGQWIGGEEAERPAGDGGSTAGIAASAAAPTETGTLRFGTPPGPDGKSDGTSPSGARRSTACTPEYASPEQCAHILGGDELPELDGRADLWSLGVVGYQMLTGELPYPNPVDRADLLRMHLERDPRRLRDLGLPRARRLAAFVDRCLERDRDRRFRDAAEAHRALARIVQPPVWEIAGKALAAAAVALFLALAAWAVLHEPPRAHELLAVRGGKQIHADPLYMGPMWPGGKLTFDGAVEPRLVGTSLGVVSADDGAALPGFGAVWVSVNEIELTAPALRGFLSERVRLEPASGDARFEPFTLTYLGADAWRVARMGFSVDGTVSEEVAVDPAGLDLWVWIGGQGQDEIRRVQVRVADGLDHALSRRPPTTETPWAIPLDELVLKPGPATLTVTVRDEGMRDAETEVPIVVVRGPLDVVSADLLGRRDDGELEALPVGDRLAFVTPGDDPVLRLELLRPSDVTWRVLVGEGEAEALVAEGTSAGARLHDLALGAFDLAEGPVRGRVAFSADDSRYVEREPDASRGNLTGEVPFLFTRARAAFEARLVRPGDGGEGRPFVAGEPMFTGREAELVLTGLAGVVSRVDAEVTVDGTGPDGEQRATTTRSSHDLRADPGGAGDRSAVPRAVVPLPALARAVEGTHRVRLEARLVDPASGEVADRADEVRELELVVDVTPPVLRLPDEETLVAAGPIRVPMIVSASPGAPVRALSARLTVAEGEPRAGEERNRWTVDGPPVGALEVPEPEGLPDGRYAIEVAGADLAGNAIEPARATVVVARESPDVSVFEPQTGVWRAAPGSRAFPLRVVADDPNGVTLVSAKVVREGEELDVHLVRDGTAFAGTVALDASWSGARPTLEVTATDLYGNTTSRRFTGYELPAIAAPRYPRIAFDGAGSMRRIAGNAGFEYVFGGRQDALENEVLRAAGLPPLAPAPGRAPSVSFGIRYAPGDIEDFYLDEHEVSAAQFLDFLLTPGGYDDPSHRPPGSAPVDRARMAELLVRLRAAPGDLPVTGVTWEEASAYARWAGKRLPSWVEWELAVRGAAYRPVASAPAAAGASAGATPAPCGTTGDVAPDTGVFDLCTNVSEWTASPWRFDPSADESPREHARAHAAKLLAPPRDEAAAWASFWIAGGSFAGPHVDFAVVDDLPRDAARDDVGFRCALSVAEWERRRAAGLPTGEPAELPEPSAREEGRP